MRYFSSTIPLVLLGVAAIGCTHKPEPISVQPSSAETSTLAKSKGGNLATLHYDTGDVEEWPDYNLPLNHSFDPYEVPPEIVGPFPESIIPQAGGAGEPKRAAARAK